MPVKDETGKRYHRLTVIKRVENNYRGDAQWLCLCDCGKEKTVKGISLRSGHTKSCGCLQKETVQQQGYDNTYDLIGKKFSKLTVVERIPGDKSTRGKWKCLCECGGETITTSDKLVSGHSQSCGCIQSKNVYHIAKVLSELNIPFIKEYTFSDLISNKNYVLRFDFAIFDKEGKLLFLIEYDGIQHFDKTHPFWTEDISINDARKEEYCKENKINLYRINYKEEALDELTKVLKKEGIFNV